MGIHGIFKEIGSGQRIALAKVAADHYIAHNRPFRLAIDISIWLFQIQAGKGGSNPALRTFYYRLLRLLSLSIHPLFVFDGPNKPLFKRNKRVGGPGVRVASVPEFLAKQLLKQFGFPYHVAPGEAEAECALLQREGIVDAVLSEDVDTIMFGSTVTLKNWTSESSSKSPTHVNLYRAEETKETSGLDPQGMILVALMSGGDYIPTGIPGCGPKVASDAARAGFGADLCALGRKDSAGLKAWKERLQHEIRTNESGFFKRKSNVLVIPEDFPNAEVMGYYTNPCVSTQEKLQKLRDGLKWDQEIDYTALRTFAADAFDWRCIGGAKKFIKNLAPAMLVRDLRLRAERKLESDHPSVKVIHGKRNHATTDGIIEYRISFIPAELVPIDLSIEEEDDEHTHAADDSDAESDDVTSTARPVDDTQPAAPASPKKRVFKPFDPDAPEKLWLMSIVLQLGCPLMLEDYEASMNDPRAFLKASYKAKRTGKTGRRPKKPLERSQSNTVDSYFKVTKTSTISDRDALQEVQARKNLSLSQPVAPEEERTRGIAVFKLPSSQIPAATLANFENLSHRQNCERRPAWASPSQSRSRTAGAPADIINTPTHRKQPAPAFNSPLYTQRTIEESLSASAKRKQTMKNLEPIDLTLSSPPQPDTPTRSITPPRATRDALGFEEPNGDLSFGEPPGTVTRRKKRSPFKRSQTAPVHRNVVDIDINDGDDDNDDDDDNDNDYDEPRRGLLEQLPEHTPSRSGFALFRTATETRELDSPASANSDSGLPSPRAFIRTRSSAERPAVDLDDTFAAAQNASSTANFPSFDDVPKDTSPVLRPLPNPHSEVPESLDLTGRATLDDMQPGHPLGQTITLEASTTSALTTDTNAQSQQLLAPAVLPTKPVKKLIQLRQSLAGSWKEVDCDAADMLDLTGNNAGGSSHRADNVGVHATKLRDGGLIRTGVKTSVHSREVNVSHKKPNEGAAGRVPRGWRKSTVEVMDLTDA